MAFQIVKIPDLPLASSITNATEYPIETTDGTKRVTQSTIDEYSSGLYIRKNVNDTTTGVITGAGFTVSSSKKLKEDIKPIDPSTISKVLELVPVTYTFKKDSPVTPGKLDVGLIAEDVQKILPMLVVEDTNGVLSIDYSKLSVYLLVVIKELTQQINVLVQS